MIGKNIKNPFALLNGEIIHISSVDSAAREERRHSFSCPDKKCGAKLIANLGGAKTHYFSHASATKCNELETAVHRMAKTVLCESLMVRLPRIEKEVSLYDSHLHIHYGEPAIYEAKELTAKSAQEEVSFGTYKPDVVFYTGNQELLIEIKKEHEVDKRKAEKVILSGKNMIEIDLSSLTENDVLDTHKFKDFVINRATRKWINFPHIDWLVNENLKKLQPVVDAINAKLKIEDDEEERIINEKRLVLKPKIDSVIKCAVSNEWLKNNEAKLKAESLSYAYVKQCLDVQSRAKIKFIDITNKNDWAFKVHRTVWQAYILNEYIIGRQQIDVGRIYSDVKNKFGLIDHVEELAHYKKARFEYDDDHGWGGPPEQGFYILTEK